jgi:hypothetical protein
MPEACVLLLVINSTSPVAAGHVSQIDRYVSLNECKSAAGRAVMKAPGTEWIALNAQWACIPGQASGLTPTLASHA